MRLLTLDSVGTLREHVLDLIEHFSNASEITKEFRNSDPMTELGVDTQTAADLLKRMLFQELSRGNEAFLHQQTNNLWAANVSSERGTPLEKPYVRKSE